KPITLVMRLLYFAVFLLLCCSIFAQSFPVAIDDSAQVMSQKVVVIPVLENDYDPDGDSIIISKVYSANHGEEWHDDTLAYYQSEWFEGWDEVKYKNRKYNAYYFESEYAYIHIEVLPNPDVPFAINDTFSIKRLEVVDLDVLHNDGDPNGDEFIVDGVSFSSNFFEVDIADDQSYVTVTTKYSTPEEYRFYYENIEKETTNQYYSNEARVHLIVEENPDIPTAVNDTFQMTGGIPQILDVLFNDLDPLEDTIEIFNYTIPNNGNATLVDNQFHVTINTSFAGNTFFEYTWRYKNKPWLYTEEARVQISVNKNPDCPVGDSDYGSGLAYIFIPVEVLSNDYDPGGDEIEIMDVKAKWANHSSIHFSNDTVFYRAPAYINGIDTAFYKIRKVNHPEYFSEWIPIIYDVSWNPGYPLCIPDSGTTTGAIPVHIDFRSNDIIPDSLNNLSVHIQHQTSKGIATRITDSVLLYTPYSRCTGRDTVRIEYLNFNFNPFKLAKGEVYIDIINNHSYDSLYINNINAGFNASGFQFSRINEFPGTGIQEYNPHFEVPKGSGIHTMFCNTIWIGGFDSEGELHIAAERYRNHIPDFQVGPVNYGTYDTSYIKLWNRMWNVTKAEVSNHINNWWKEEYDMPEPIENWPGNGEGLMAEQLAPYFDQDADGIYDPWAGDYPLIRGDHCLYFIINDDKYHENTQADSMLVEIHGMAYAFDAPEDSILNNTIFVHYDIINRSELTYHDAYFGAFTDFALGYEWDDYVGSHVSGNSYYAYSDDIDGSGEPGSYGNKPPAQSVTFLAGPYLDPDNTDNPSGLCDEGINGLNFGNGAIDDERHGMSYFMFFDGGGGPQGDPVIGIEYYNFMRALWKDETHMIFGGYGHFNSGGVGPECRYLWPGDSDPENWGTGCILPNEGYNQNGKWWTEMGEGVNGYDAHGMASSGPFTFKPGDIQEVDLAFLFANSNHSADSSVKLLGDRLLELRQRVLDGEIIIPNNELAINEGTAEEVSITIYPNPARDMIHIKGVEKLAGAEYRIYNMMGTCIQNGKASGEININGLEKGFYIVSIITANGISSGKFVKQ
ncbi:MAG: hypothetical protein DRJ15_09330, partial [Bacteroidetes bacterium]